MSATKSYLLPCDCSARIPVGPGQAGGSVTCPQCGIVTKVPRLGDLARLEVAAVLDALLDRGVTRIELAGEVGVSASNIIAGVTEAPVILHTT